MAQFMACSFVEVIFGGSGRKRQGIDDAICSGTKLEASMKAVGNFASFVFVWIALLGKGGRIEFDPLDTNLPGGRERGASCQQRQNWKKSFHKITRLCSDKYSTTRMAIPINSGSMCNFIPEL